MPLGARFSARIQTVPVAHPASCRMGSGSLSQPVHGFDHPPPSSTEVEEKVDKYLYSPLWAFMSYSRVNLLDGGKGLIAHF